MKQQEISVVYNASKVIDVQASALGKSQDINFKTPSLSLVTKVTLGI